MEAAAVMGPQAGVPAGTGGNLKLIWYKPTDPGVVPV